MRDLLNCLAVIAIGAVVIFTGVIGVAYLNTTALPLPPNFTSAELNQRIEDFGVTHMAACVTCQIAKETPNLPAPRCYDAARTQALVVGDWVAIGCKTDDLGLLWQYVGRPINGWRWSTITQTWRPLRRIPRCPQ